MSNSANRMQPSLRESMIVWLILMALVYLQNLGFLIAMAITVDIVVVAVPKFKGLVTSAMIAAALAHNRRLWVGVNAFWLPFFNDRSLVSIIAPQDLHLLAQTAPGVIEKVFEFVVIKNNHQCASNPRNRCGSTSRWTRRWTRTVPQSGRDPCAWCASRAL